MFDIIQRKKWPITKGIYKIWFNNSSTGKVYIGSTFSKYGFKRRWGQHILLLRKKTHPSIRLQNAYNKYDETNIRFSVIEEVLDISKIIETEQSYIDSYDSYRYGYNCSPIAGSQLGFKYPKRIISKIKKTKWKRFELLTPQIIELYQQGKTLKEVAKLVNINYHTVSKILKHNNVETKRKADYTKIPIYQFSKTGEFIKRWTSAYEASNELNLYESGIRSVLKGNCIFCGEFHFSYNPDISYVDIQSLIYNKKQKSKNTYKEAMTDDRLALLNQLRLSKENPFNRITDVEQYDQDGNLIKIWKDTKEIVEFYGLKNATPVLRVIKGERKKFKETIWKSKNYKQRNCKLAKDQTRIT